MKPIKQITGRVAPLERSDVDTDQIIPAVWLKRVERTGFGEGLFSAWRESDPTFVLNRPEFQGAKILVAGPNFGTGSSREHAVWALMDAGFEAVISSKFGDIFRNNSTKAGLVPVQVDEETGLKLLEAAAEVPFLEVTIDMATKTVSAPQAGITANFTIDDFTQGRLMEGLDDIGLTMRHESDITTYEAARPAWMPPTTRPAAV